MGNIRRILVISRMNPYSHTVFNYGVSLARKNDAKLLVLHLLSNPADMLAMNVPGLFPVEYSNYMYRLPDEKEHLDKVIKQEISEGFPIQELTSDSDTVEEIERIVSEEKIDLLVMHAQQEGLLEHALFGGQNDAIIRRMPCSILLVKDEPKLVT